MFIYRSWSTHSLARWFSFIERVIWAAKKIFPSVYYTLVLNHAIRRINWEISKIICILPVNSAMRVRSLTLPTPGHTLIPNFAQTSVTVLLWAFLSLSTTTISTPAFWRISPNSSRYSGDHFVFFASGLREYTELSSRTTLQAKPHCSDYTGKNKKNYLCSIPFYYHYIENDNLTTFWYEKHL